MRLTKTELNSVPIYNLSSVGKALPLWVHDKKSRAGKARAKLRPADAAGEHVEVIQDLFFPTMCGKAKLSSDGETLLTTGGYPPQLRAFELRELSLKFERHFNAEVVDFQVLSADWKKAVYLLADRSVEFHTQFGKHHTTRIPVHGRCLGYQPETTELLLAGAGPEVYRLSLERGAFLQPLDSGAAGVNAIGVDPTHGMVVLGTADGTVQCWDPRQRSLLGAASPFAAIDAVDGFGGGGPAPAGGLHLGSPERSVTSVRFDPGGLLLAAGTSSGHVALYDVRSSRPVPRGEGAGAGGAGEARSPRRCARRVGVSQGPQVRPAGPLDQVSPGQVRLCRRKDHQDLGPRRGGGRVGGAAHVRVDPAARRRQRALRLPRLWPPLRPAGGGASRRRRPKVRARRGGRAGAR